MKRHLLAAAVLTTLIAGAQAPANAASFVCMNVEGTKTTAERVCNSRWLSNLDERMDSWYRRALERARYFDQTAKVRSEQRNWIANRDSCGTSFWCIRRAYVKRIRDLENYVEHV
jgi:uncharacterized protein